MKKQIRRTTALWPVAVSALMLTPTMLKAAEVDLATGNSGTANGALFVWTESQPTGTGYIDPFVRIQANGTEQGYNTSGRPFAFDEKDPINYTHDLQLSQLGSGVNINGTEYYQFLLDINEAGGRKSMLSLDNLQLYTSQQASQTTADVGSLGTLRYDLDAGTDNWVLLDASRNNGSGSGDMFAFIPKANFAGASPDDYVYLYSKFGMADDADSEAGFEEWALVNAGGGGGGNPPAGGTTGGTSGGTSGGTTGGGPSPVPEPSTYAILGSFIAFAGYLKARKAKANA